MKKLLLFFLSIWALVLLCSCSTGSEPDPIASINPVIDYEKINPDTDLLLVKGDNGKYGFIDTKGNIAITPQFLLALPFSDGLASITMKEYHGYIDKTGKLILKNTYSAAFPFINGHAIFKVDIDGKERFGIIDKAGNEIVKPIYRQIFRDIDGMMAVVNEKGLWGYLDSATCSEAILPIYEQADAFDHGHAAVKSAQDGKWKYIDKQGKATNIAIASNYEQIIYFQIYGDGRDIPTMEIVAAQNRLLPTARAKVNDYGYCGNGIYWGTRTDYYSDDVDLIFFDFRGNIRLKTSGMRAGIFSEGLCAVQNKDNRWGYIDRNGNVVIDFIFEEDAGAFKNGIARVDSCFILLLNMDISDKRRIEYSKYIKIGYIDRQGNYIWKPR